ncbi:MAG: flippase-like domain-containing protein [Candidatus Aenigmarchaeota archaeon]|nr:flippase-like domain-containing protein [Candidatus Aenigmarchaeota archaeon]
MKISRLFSLVGIFLFVYILANIDIVETLHILSKADIFLIFLSLLIVFLSVIIKSLKWKMLISIYDKEYSLKSATKAWLMGFSLSMMTPARIGDLSRAYYAKHRIGIGKSLTTVIIDRVIDIAILFCLAIVGLISFVAFFTQHTGLFFVISVFFVVFLFGVYITTKKEVVKMFLKPVFKRFVPEKHKSNINVTFHDFYSGLGSLKKNRKKVFYAVILGVLVWIASVFQYFILSMSIGLDVSFLFLFSVVPIVTLLDMLPVSFSGIGTRDAALILFFSFISVGKEYAISLSLLVLFIGYVPAGLMGAAFLLKGEQNAMAKG